MQYCVVASCAGVDYIGGLVIFLLNRAHHRRGNTLTTCLFASARRGVGSWVGLAGGLAALSCNGITPSVRMREAVQLPVPSSLESLPRSDRLTPAGADGSTVLSPTSLIRIAFEHQPHIKSSFEHFQAEEARYDFFYTSHDSLTPRFRTNVDIEESRADKVVARDRDHTAELSLEKRFFDTTRMNIGLGYRNCVKNDDVGDHPFVLADVRYPLWASREKLERASEDIFRQNELNDALLAYIQQVRRQLRQALSKFHEVVDLGRRIEALRQRLADLRALAQRIDAIKDRDTTADEARLEAEVSSISAELRNDVGWRDVQLAWLKSACGLPFFSKVELADEPFNPFEGMSHEELLQVSIETDPEIATQRNSARNAEVQLDLARRGRWDIALLLAARSSLEGRGEEEGQSAWSISAGFEISAVDPRVTDSLIRQAKANVARFKQAISARENAIFVGTLEPLIRIETLGASRHQLIGNLPRYQEDYTRGVREYIAGNLNIDDLLTRRGNLFSQEREISRLTFLVAVNVAELCAATGKFFELLEQEGIEPGNPIG